MFLSLPPRHAGASIGLTPEKPIFKSVQKPQAQFAGSHNQAGSSIPSKDQLTLSKTTALNPNAQIVDSTPLLDAVAIGNLESAKALLKAGSDTLSITPQGITPLVLAVGLGNVPMTQLLLDHGAPLHSYYNNVPLFHLAVQTGNVEILNVLKDAGTDVNQRDTAKRTPLHYAATQDKPEVINWLLANGADLEARDNQGDTPLHHAVQYGREQAYAALQKAGANLNTQNHLGLTPYLTAAGTGKVRLMKALQTDGANTQATTRQGLPALHWAAGLNQAEVLRHLLSPKHKTGSDIELNKTAGTLDYNPLHLAVAFQSNEAIGELVKGRKKGLQTADWHVKDKNGASAWDYAQEHGPEFINRWRPSAEPCHTAQAAHATAPPLEPAQQQIELPPSESVELTSALPDLNLLTISSQIKPDQTSPFHNAGSRKAGSTVKLSPKTQSRVQGTEDKTVSAGSKASKSKKQAPPHQEPGISATTSAPKAGKSKNKKQQPAMPATPVTDELDEALRAVYGVQAIKQSGKQYENFLDFLNDHDETLGKLDLKGKCDFMSKHLNGLNVNKPYQILVTTAADPNNHKPIQVTPLHVAILNPMPVELVRLFVEKGADPSIKDTVGRTPFHLAALTGSLDYLNALAGKKKGIFQSKNIDDWKNMIGNTPLHDAVRSGHLDATEWFLNKKFPVNLKNENGETPLHIAANNGYPAIISLLLKHGANLESKNSSDRTPIHLAALNGDMEALKMLAKAGKKIFPIKNIDGWKALDGNTPLHEAAKWGHLKACQWLLDQQFLIDTPNQDNQTSLHLAAEGGYTELAEMLLKNDANPNAKTKTGMTPLHSAAHNMASETLEALLRFKKTNPNAGLINGLSALHIAVVNHDLTSVRLLLANGADINKMDNTGRGPLRMAVMVNDAAMVKELLNQGADPTQLDEEGSNVLHHLFGSRKNDDPERVLAILNDVLSQVSPETAQEMVNTRDTRFQNTPLHVALAMGNIEAVKRLLAHGADPLLTNCAGKNALMLAIDNHNTSVVSEFLEILLKQPDAIVKAMMTGKTKEEGASALHLAAALNLSEALKTLVKKQKELVAKGMPAELLDLNGQDKAGNTPLHYATKLGQIKSLRFLLSQDVDLSKSDGASRTPLMEAVSYTSKGDPAESQRASVTMVDEILAAARSKAIDAEQSQHAAVASLIDQSDYKGSSALHLAAQYGKLSIFKKLLQQGGNALLLNNFGGSPLHVAADYGHPEVSQQMVESLLEAYNRLGGAPLVQRMVEMADQSGITPLVVASTLRRPELEKRMRTYTHRSTPPPKLVPVATCIAGSHSEKRKVVKVPYYAV